MKTSSIKTNPKKSHSPPLSLTQRRAIWGISGALFLYEQWIVLQIPAWAFWISLLAMFGSIFLLSKRFFQIRLLHPNILNILVILFGLINAILFFTSAPYSKAIAFLMSLLTLASSWLFLWPLMANLYQTVAKRSWIQKMSIFLSSRRFLLGMMVFTFILMLIDLREAFSLDVWIDESFSMELISKNIFEIISLTAQDVHPPLFYLYLKLGVSLLTTIFSRLHPIFAARLMCEIPYLVVWILCMRQLAPRFGNFVASLAMFSLFGMPTFFGFSIEIRMYGLSMLWILEVFLAIYDLESTSKTKQKSWYHLAIFSLLAAYTHYYAAITAGIGWLFLLAWLYKTGNKKGIKRWFRTLILCGIGYLPWIFVLFKQLQTVKADYWIAPITLADFPDYLNYAFHMYLPWVLFFLILSFLKHPFKEAFKSWFAQSCLWLPFLVIAFGILVSILFRPIYVARYVFSALFIFWIGVFMIVGASQNAKLRLWFVCGCLFLGMVCFSTDLSDKRYNRLRAPVLYKEVITAIESADVPEEDLYLVCGNSHLWRNLHIALDRVFYVQEGQEDKEPITTKVYGEAQIIGSDYKLEDLLLEGKKVFFIGSNEELGAFKENPSFKIITLYAPENFGSSLKEVGVFAITLANSSEDIQDKSNQAQNTQGSVQSTSTSSSSSTSS